MTTTPITWANCQVTLGELQPWADNPRLSTKAQARRLLESWQRFGQVQTIAIGPAGQVYDGHQRLSALLTLHGKSYQVDARRSDRELTDEERRELVVTLHAGAVGAWNWEELSNWEAGLLQEWGFDSDTLTNWQRDVTALGNLLASEEADSADAEPQIDRAAELQEKWQVKPGDLWRIGEHRLACGDCTDKAVVERVMGGEKARLVVTDPPYGVDYAAKNKFLNSVAKGNRIQTDIEGDHGTKEETQALWKAAFEQMDKAMAPGAVVYCFMPQGGDQMMMMMMMGAGIEPRHELIWLKNNHVLGRVDYAYKHEPILYAWKAGGHKFYGDFQTSVIECKKPQNSDLHPTTKPVELIEKLVANSSQSTEVAFDPFLGSGTTLVACQNLHRRGRGIEISPEYCAVTLERMSDAFPGIEIERIADDGRQ